MSPAPHQCSTKINRQHSLMPAATQIIDKKAIKLFIKSLKSPVNQNDQGLLIETQKPFKRKHKILQTHNPKLMNSKKISTSTTPSRGSPQGLSLNANLVLSINPDTNTNSISKANPSISTTLVFNTNLQP